jgi:hypothetical protein
MNAITDYLADWWMSEVPLDSDYEDKDECECEALGSECQSCEDEL